MKAKKFYVLAVTGMFLVAGFGACSSKSSDKPHVSSDICEDIETMSNDKTEESSNENSRGSDFVEIADNPSNINVKLSSQLKDNIIIKSIKLDGKKDLSSYDPVINLIIELKEPFDFKKVLSPHPQLTAIAFDDSGKVIEDFGPENWVMWNVGWKDFLEFCKGEPGEILSVRMRPYKLYESEEEMNESLGKIKEFVINLKR